MAEDTGLEQAVALVSIAEVPELPEELDQEHTEIKETDQIEVIEQSENAKETEEHEQTEQAADTEQQEKNEESDQTEQIEEQNHIDQAQEVEQPVEEIHTIEPNSGSDDSDFDSDFDDFNEAVVYTLPVKETKGFSEDVLANDLRLETELSTLLDSLFPPQDNIKHDSESTSTSLLSERALVVFDQLSRTPYLRPPNWTRLKIRYNLLLRLGIPINLDELAALSSTQTQTQTGASRHRRRVSGVLDRESDIDWTGFELPLIEGLSAEETELIKTTTAEVLSNIELAMLSHTSERFLLDSDMAVVDDKLAQLELFYRQLLTVGSVWKQEISNCHSEFETYENVIQSVIGYSQKLKREEILHKLHS